MSGFEIFGTIAGVLGGFKGAVDGYNLLVDMFASDTEIDSVATAYNVESIRFKVWGEGVKLDDASACLLKNKDPYLLSAVAKIIAEILNTQEKVLKHFNAKYQLPPLPDAPKNPVFSPQSAWIAQLRAERTKMKVRHRWSWVTREKAELKDLVDRLHTQNNILQSLVPSVSEESRIVKAIMTELDERLSLASVHGLDGTAQELIALGRQIKAIQEQDMGTVKQQVKQIDKSELDVLCPPDAVSGRYTGSYDVGGGPLERVLVEWKRIDAGNAFAKDIVARIQVLGALLSTKNAHEFHRLTFLGLFDDKDFEHRKQGLRRVGLVYSIPTGPSNPNPPRNLLELIQKDAKNHTRPALGDRFHLARKLASAMSLFHVANWLHKSFRSDNILFGYDEDITKPYISGFQYGRPAADASIETRPVGDPRLDLYYHPDVMNGWSTIKEIYSLGIVLLEVAYWRPMFEKSFQNMTMQQVSNEIVTSLNGKFGRDLAGMVGTAYVDVVKCCLTGSLGVQRGDSREEARILSKQFSLSVIQPLTSCKA